MSGMTAKQRVDADLQRGQSLGVSGTPTVYINNRMVPAQQMTGAGFKEIIDGELAKTSGGGQNQSATTVTVPSSGVNKTTTNTNAKPVNK